jgi:hypothetical protein
MYNSKHQRDFLENGWFGATVGFQHLSGNFAKDMFEGTFYCVENDPQDEEAVRITSG